MRSHWLNLTGYETFDVVQDTQYFKQIKIEISFPFCVVSFKKEDFSDACEVTAIKFLGGFNDDDELKYYCRNCGHEDNKISIDELKINVYEKNINTQININPWIKYDPTLPHIHTIKCPNEKCKSNEKEKTSDIIYIRYNDVDMKYMYLCTICDYNWKP